MIRRWLFYIDLDMYGMFGVSVVSNEGHDAMKARMGCRDAYTNDGGLPLQSGGL